MGYSISVKFKNENEKEKMKSFLLENQDLIEEMSSLDRRLKISNYPEDGENLGYAPKKKFLLGFHGSGIPHHIWHLCAWMSVKTEAKKGEDNYFFYDDEKMVVTKDLNNKTNTLVDDRGIFVIEEESPSFFTKVVRDLILGEKSNKLKLQRLMVSLDEKWLEYVNQEKIEKKPKRSKKILD